MSCTGDAAPAAAELLSAAERIREDLGFDSTVPPERIVKDRAHAAAAAALDENELAAALERGRQLTFDQAVARALEATA